MDNTLLLHCLLTSFIRIDDWTNIWESEHYLPVSKFRCLLGWLGLTIENSVRDFALLRQPFFIIATLHCQPSDTLGWNISKTQLRKRYMKGWNWEISQVLKISVYSFLRCCKIFIIIMWCVRQFIERREERVEWGDERVQRSLRGVLKNYCLQQQSIQEQSLK